MHLGKGSSSMILPTIFVKDEGVKTRSQTFKFRLNARHPNICLVFY